jgi:hypothetical protein
MTKDEIIEELLKLKIIRKRNDSYFIVNNAIPVKAICKNLPSKYAGLSSTQAMEQFFDDCKIPGFFNTDKLKFDARTQTKESRKIFMGIIKDSSIDFSILVSRTRQYYAEKNSAKKPMAKYFTEGLWRNIYKFYKEDKKTSGNTFWA